MGGGGVSFKQLVEDHALRPGQRRSDQTVRSSGNNWEQIYTSSRWRDRWRGPPANPMTREKYNELLSGKTDNFRQSAKQESLFNEAGGRVTTLFALKNHLKDDWPLTHRVVHEYKALYGRDLWTTYVTRGDLHRLDKIAKRVQKTAEEQRGGITVINPKIEATKRAVRMITEQFEAARNRGPDHQKKLKELKDLQARLDRVGPRADPREVQTIARKAIKDMGLAKYRFYGLGRLKYGVKVDFQRTLHRAYRAVRRELEGKPRSPRQEQWRMAMNHLVAQLLDHRDRVDGAIVGQKRKILDEEVKPEPEDGSNQRKEAIKKLKSDLKDLERVRDAMADSLPKLSSMCASLTHLSHRPDTDYAAARKTVHKHLKRIDAALGRRVVVDEILRPSNKDAETDSLGTASNQGLENDLPELKKVQVSSIRVDRIDPDGDAESDSIDTQRQQRHEV